MMKHPRLNDLWGAALLFFLFSFSLVSADDVTTRMRERLPAIDALKAEGLIGENNAGYLEARTELSTGQSALVAAENTDRLELYSLIAAKTDSSVPEVGKQRAVRIAQQAKSGVWIETPGGEWIRKGQ